MMAAVGLEPGRSFFLKIQSSTIALVLNGLTTAGAILVSVFAPDLDVEIANRLFDPVANGFPAASQQTLVWLRDQGYVIVAALFGCIICALVVKLVAPQRPLLVPARAIIFLAVTMAIGPGLMVNAIFKPHGGRPRPVEIRQFGGQQSFVPWWSFEGGCHNNCSFVSGETSTAAWLFAPAILVPAPWRAVAIAGAALFTASVGALRMAYGGHFFSDVVFATLMTCLVIWLAHGLIFRWARTRLDETAIDRRVADLACTVRRVFSGK
jgi:lipid A 4'-phosphatase